MSDQITEVRANGKEHPLPSTAPKSLVQKLAEAGAAIGWIEKSGRNAYHGYNYATEADLVAALRGELFKRGVFIFPTMLDSQRNAITVVSSKGERTTALTNVTMRWTFVDGETGEKFDCDIPGCGEDSGDKGIYKAMTGSEKYLLMKAFLIPTGDDPEKDTEHEKKEAWDSGTKAAQAVAQRKIAEHEASPDKPIEFLRGLEGWMILAGDSVSVLRAEAPPAAIDLMVKVDKGWEVPEEKALSFYKLAQRHKIPVNISNEDFKRIETAAAPVTPRTTPADDDLPTELYDDPHITSVKSLTGKKGAYLKVFWNGREYSCFRKPLFRGLTEGLNHGARLVTEENGEYSNITDIERIGNRQYEGGMPVRHPDDIGTETPWF